VQGLARVVEALGVDIFESTAVTEIRPRSAGEPATAVTGRGAPYAPST
jgi:hypothetical protein